MLDGAPYSGKGHVLHKTPFQPIDVKWLAVFQQFQSVFC